MKAKKTISELHDKYYGKKKPAIKETDRETALRIAPELKPSLNEGIILHTGASRNELMLQAKGKGIKNYRVLNKQELSDALKNIGNQVEVDRIVAGAVARWKSGWGKKAAAQLKEQKQ
jgi:hypothetical protein